MNEEQQLTEEVVDTTGARHVTYPSTAQFRSVVKQVRDIAGWNGVPLPKLKFTGTVKLHGTNAAVVGDGTEVWHQSRERVITPVSDNAGFSQYATFHADFFKEMHVRARTELGLDGTDTKIAIYGEWCGGNIQAGVGINGIDKIFVVFAIAFGEPDHRTWATKKQRVAIVGPDATEHKVYLSHDFGEYEMVIDFVNPEASQNALVEITTQVEQACPAAKFFGKEGIGEGVVWVVEVDSTLPLFVNLFFKVKGEKHSASKVKKLAEVDPVKVANVIEFVETTCTVNRMQQMRDKLVEMELDPNDVKNTGVFLKYIGSDIIKEESDTLEASGLTSKDVGGKIAQKAREWFMSKIGE